MKKQLFTILMLVGFLAERFLFSYQFSYLVALVALVILIRYPQRRHLVPIIALTCIAIVSDLGIISVEVRYIAFILMFLVLFQIWECDPRYLFCFQVAFLLLSMVSTDVSVERFVFGTAVSAMVLMVYLQRKPRLLLRHAFQRFLLVISLLLPIVGYGSRAALMMWLAINWRVTIIAAPVAFLSAGFLVTSTFLEIPLFQKLLYSLTELSASGESGQPIDLRGLENLIFLQWLGKASVWQIVVGSGFQEALPGSIIGNQFDDFAYIPHNFLFGMFFQFGILGTLVLIWSLHDVIRSISPSFEVRMLALILILIGLVVKHGFFDTDLIMLLAAIRFIEARNDLTAQIKNEPSGVRSARSAP